MSQEIGDDASIKFSEGFYDALGAGKPPDRAYEFGKSAIDLRNLREYLVPVLLKNAQPRRYPPPSMDRNTHSRVVPRGLRSFSVEDSDFFLDLLPGVRGQDGLPLSLRFWKTRIDETDAQATFPVGLIYGPSGCGKSSFVKAGLVPRLSEKIVPVFVEATASDTEARLKIGLLGICSGIKDGASLLDILIAVKHQNEATGRKTLLVIDQFEQWLHGRAIAQTTELAAALRLCDGKWIQCILMVRDDFWVAVNRFLKDVAARISEGDNSALVDLFDIRHAGKVLNLFGEAYGAWNAHSGIATDERDQFVDQAVSGLAREGRVIPVRLALFCELFKGRPWTLESIKQVGGVEGVGVKYLEETFSSDTAPAEHRHHQKAARAVLKALLPETGILIKGNMRSYRALLEASGHAQRPAVFEDLLQILDRKTRLITPTDPGAPEDEEPATTAAAVTSQPAGERFYQLTHDYLVPSLREWLTSKQKETRRGRAEIRLADRAALWNSKPENRHLPSAWEWATIRLLTKQKDWTEPQQRMMKKAQRVHGRRVLVLCTVLLATTVVGLWVRSRDVEKANKNSAHGLVQELLHANLEDVPVVISDMREYREWVDPLLKKELQESADGSQKQLHASLALLSVDPGQVAYLTKRTLKANPTELSVIWRILRESNRAPVQSLKSILGDPKADPGERFRAACVLAKEQDSDLTTSWNAGAQLIIDRLLKSVSENPSDYTRLIGML
jgi:hypothetical protein